jgi:hypothetical protein
MTRCDGGCGVEVLQTHYEKNRGAWSTVWPNGTSLLHFCPACTEKRSVALDLAMGEWGPIETQASAACGWALDFGLRLGPIPTDITREGLGSQMRRRDAFHEQQKQKASVA